jgi:hypothetical protein
MQPPSVTYNEWRVQVGEEGRGGGLAAHQARCVLRVPPPYSHRCLHQTPGAQSDT